MTYVVPPATAQAAEQTRAEGVETQKLAAASALADVPDKGTARLNLDLAELKPCRIAVTVNVASLSGLQTLDETPLAAGDRVLLTNQTAKSQNGVWVAASGAWTRPSDFPTGAVISSPRKVFITGGVSQLRQSYYFKGPTITVDTSNQVWDTAVPSSVQGATGPSGPQGATGPGGPTGPQGSTGPAGIGATGAAGPQGASGATGAQGIPGTAAAQGATGATGEAGPPGPSGPKGPTGPTGAAGPTGPGGPAGATGAGSTGPVGATGAAGPAGASGPAGAAGATGAAGGVGPAGATGPTVPSTVERNEVTANYTLVLGDAGKRIVANKATTTQVVTVPTNASVAFPVGTVVEFVQKGSGQVEIVGASGVTINTPSSRTTRTQWAALSIVKEATNEWTLSGDMT